jgi:murein DD-endopeptidase MepM/ murein hydrolase activator NlpD
MRKLFYLVVSIVIFGLIISGCIFHVVPPLDQDGSIDIVKNDVFFEIDLIAGQHTVAGSITVSNDDKNLFITYETIDSWLINETHLYVDTIIPTKSEPGKFPYKHEELDGVTTDTYKIPLDDLGVGPCDIVYIAAHAELVKGETEETGWAKGVKIEPGKNWAMYFNYQISSYGSEIPELTEAISQEVNLSLGGEVEITDPESIINGVKLIIPPIPSEKKGGKLIANITISYIDDPYSLELPDNRGFLLPPVVINSDILFDAECILEIPYTEATLNNMGLSNDKNIKVYRYNYISSSWEEVLINKRNYKAEIDFDYMLELTLVIEEPNMTYACSTPSIFLPPHGFPQPGDLLYKLSFYGVSEGWIPGHVGIYVGEFEKDSEGEPYNVIEALLFGGVQRNYYNPISDFSGSAAYMGARQPKEFDSLTSIQRDIIIQYAKGMVGLPYAIETFSFYFGLARGDWVKGTDALGSYNCVGLAEKAYEIAGVNGGQGLVSDLDEGNFCILPSPTCVLTPVEQYAKTEPAEGYSVSGKVTDSQGVEIPDVTLNLESVSFNDYHYSFEVTTDSDGKWSSDKLGREWKVTPQKDGYTFEPSTIKVKEDANDINFTGTFITGSQYLIQWSTAESNGWANPLGEGKELITSTSYDYDSPIYLNNWGKRHVGIDVHAQLDSNVFSIADGTIRKIVRGSDPKKMVVIIEHTNSNNEDLFAIYGHVLAKEDLEEDNEVKKVKAGEKIGVVKESGSPCHLHFGINTSSEINDFYYGIYGWGRIPADANPSDYGWVDPMDYLNTHQTKAVVSNVVAVYWTDHYPSNSQTIEHLINVFWDPYPEAIGYKVYRSVNGMVEIEPVYSGAGELLYDKNVVQWHDFSNIVVGNTYSYYVTAYGDGWETAPSQETGTINSFLPPIYLVSPSDGVTINISTPTFEWSPVGSNPGGSINFGNTELWVKNLTDDKVIWDISFNDMTTSNATYNQDGQASPLIFGHSYAWEVTSYGFVDNIEVAISQSEYWEFTYGTVTGPVHNLTKDTYYNTIQAALDDADSDNIIEVSDGTYDESITFPSGMKIILQSVNGAFSTIIRGNNGSSTVTFDGSLAGTTLEGLTITHTDGLTGRGIHIADGYLIIENCTISGNRTNRGGGIYNGGTLTINGSTISDNFARSVWSNAFGGGIHNGGILTINGSTISGNRASGGGGYTYYGASGGGINNGGTLTINGSTISGNRASGEGGASGGGIKGGTLTMTGSSVCDNCASENGGGIYLSSTETINIGGVSPSDKNTICGNYKTGEDPSLEQQIRDSSGSLYETYKDTNYIFAYCE